MAIPLAPDDWFNAEIKRENGIFDRPSFEMAMRHVDRFRTAIDCGAHVGTWTLALADRFSKVCAFEPHPVNRDFLQGNVAGRDNISLYPCAVGDSEGRCAVADGDHNSGCAYVTAGDQVRMVRLDDAIERVDVDFIKMDLEGYELRALRGAQVLLNANSPVLCVELCHLDRYAETKEQVLTLLSGLGYVLVDRFNHDHIFKKGK